ncbi:Pre-rRNA-processing protein ipi3 [Batrachochytrium dendrobatidis]|nr:Pre-rRNA-processing protein ipi3 [Batrachochytrium dendrobatidis]KAK5665326.1 Pre-rRNA-processing protein ipi3 [Batrachochytrium dendrobatidis]
MVAVQHHISEVAISTSLKDSSIHIWDIRNGALLSTLKGNTSMPLATDIMFAIGNHYTAATTATSSNSGMVDASEGYNGHINGPGNRPTIPSANLNGWMLPSLIISAQSDRATLNTWSLGKAQPILKSVIPEKLACVCISNSGRYCLGGGFSGRLYLWEIATGNMLRMFDAHYKPVTVVRFTADDALMISGGEDAMIHLWLLADVLDESIDHQELPVKLKSLKGHTLPIADLVCGLTPSTQTRCFTASLDKTCRIWDLNTGCCLVTILFPRPLTCIQVNSLETTIYAASIDGLVRSVNLYTTSTGALHALSEGDIRDADTEPCVFRGHRAAVTSLSLSMDETLLVTGSNDGDCVVWDTVTRQALRTFKAHKEPVSNVKIVFRPPSVTNPDAHCHTLVQAFKRFPIVRKSIEKDALGSEHDGQSFVSRIPTRGLSALNDELDQELYPDAKRIYKGVCNAYGAPLLGKTNEDSLSEVDILKSRVAVLEKHNTELQCLNDRLYQGVVDHIFDTK